MTDDTAVRQVVVLAPMPLEMHAIVTAFGLSRTSDAEGRRGPDRSAVRR